MVIEGKHTNVVVMEGKQLKCAAGVPSRSKAFIDLKITTKRRRENTAEEENAFLTSLNALKCIETCLNDS